MQGGSQCRGPFIHTIEDLVARTAQLAEWQRSVINEKLNPTLN